MKNNFTLNPLLFAFRRVGGEIVYNKLVAPFFKKPIGWFCIAGVAASTLITATAALSINASFGTIIDLIKTGTTASLWDEITKVGLYSLAVVAGHSIGNASSSFLATTWQNWARKQIAQSLCEPKLRGVFASLHEKERENALQRCTGDTQSLIMLTSRLSCESYDRLTNLAIVSSVLASLDWRLLGGLGPVVAAIIIGVKAAAKKLQAADTRMANTGKEYSVALLSIAQKKIAIEQWRGENQEKDILTRKQDAVNAAYLSQTILRVSLEVGKNAAHHMVRLVPFLCVQDYAQGSQSGAARFAQTRSNTDLFSQGVSWGLVLAEPANAWISTTKRLADYIQKMEQPVAANRLPSYEAGQNTELSVKNLSVTVKNYRPLFSNEDIELKAGDRLALTGVSGCGKSTLLRQLSGSLPFSEESSVSYRGVSGPNDVLFVPQDPYIPDLLFPDILTYPSPATDFSNEEILAALEDAGLTKKKKLLDSKETGNQIASLLSGGEKQRVSIARLLLNKPKVIGLDESTSALPHDDGIALYKRLCERLPNSIIISSIHRRELLDTHTLRGSFAEKGFTWARLNIRLSPLVSPISMQERREACKNFPQYKLTIAPING